VWKRVLESSTSIAARILVWKATVMRSMLWALETTRHNAEHSSLLVTAQKMIRKMLGLKRRPLTIASESMPVVFETWLDWQKRTLSAAGKTLSEN